MSASDLDPLKALTWRVGVVVASSNADMAIWRSPRDRRPFELLDLAAVSDRLTLESYLKCSLAAVDAESVPRQLAMTAFLRSSEAQRSTANVVGIAWIDATFDPSESTRRSIEIVLQAADRTCCVQIPPLNTGESPWHRIEAMMGQAELITATGSVEPLKAPSERAMKFELVVAPQEITDLIEGNRRVCRWGSRSMPKHRDDLTPQVVFPGSFNPLHAGHRQMAEIASRRLRAPVAFEITVRNVDKPPLDFMSIAARASQFREQALFLTTAGRFVDKADLFPNATFLIGADTLDRLIDCRYYGDDASQRDQAFCHIARRGCRFMVFGRTCDASFLEPRREQLPAGIRELCTLIPESEFRVDVSSTQLRRRNS